MPLWLRLLELQAQMRLSPHHVRVYDPVTYQHDLWFQARRRHAHPLPALCSILTLAVFVTLMYSLPWRALAKRAWGSVAARPGATFVVSRALSSAAASSFSGASIMWAQVGSIVCLFGSFFLEHFLPCERRVCCFWGSDLRVWRSAKMVKICCIGTGWVQHGGVLMSRRKLA